MNYKLKKLFFFLTLVILGIPGVYGQPQGDDAPGKKRLQELRRIKMIEALDLSEDQSIRLFAREKELMKSERMMNNKKHEIIEKLQSLTTDGGSETQMTTEIQALLSIGYDMLKKREEYISSLSDLLSVKQIAKLVLFEDNFKHDIQKLLQGVRRNRREMK